MAGGLGRTRLRPEYAAMPPRATWPSFRPAQSSTNWTSLPGTEDRWAVAVHEPVVHDSVVSTGCYQRGSSLVPVMQCSAGLAVGIRSTLGGRAIPIRAQAAAGMPSISSFLRRKPERGSALCQVAILLPGAMLRVMKPLCLCIVHYR